MANDPKFSQESAFPDERIIETPEESLNKETYRRKLVEKLQDPEFRKIEGFPIGTDEAILALSDPPYYTACPNPFLPEILEEWQGERQMLREELGLPDEANLPEGIRAYRREPFAADVSEGKNDPIYNAHSYHTKVPHKAIMRYILHYTDPGDIVFDGFCGTGMTGVAAQLCGDRKVVESLGYRVDKKGVIYEGEKAISQLGARKAVLNDLSPAATFIAYNYNMPVDAQAFERGAKRILAEVEQECGWMYETSHIDGSKGRINYTVWSDVFRCPQCGQEMVFWDVAVDMAAKNTRDIWNCPSCNSRLAKRPKKDSGAIKVERVLDTLYDRAIGQTIQQARQVPVLINYSVGKKRYEKKPDATDLALIQRIEEIDIPYKFPKEPMMFIGEGWGDSWRAGYHSGITHTHHFYTRRNLWVLAAIFSKSINSKLLLAYFSDMLARASKRNRYMPEYGSRHVGVLSGTLYIPTLSEENNLIGMLSFRINKKYSCNTSQNSFLINTDSSTKSEQFKLFDYIFIDPPFGGNLMYSELNFISEAWYGVISNNKDEAIVNNAQKKGVTEYKYLMKLCLDSFFKALKPNHWMTLEFHNSQNSIWNAIQEAMMQAGFVIADVRVLDKQKGTIKQLTFTNATKKDLVISAYRPSTQIEQLFSLEGGTTSGAWEFVRQHLEQLPMPTLRDGRVEVQGERMPYLLYDRMVAFHLVRGLTVPLTASEFYQGLSQRWLSRDGMVFTSAQTTKYDQLRLQAESVQQLALFVTDEVSAIQWLRGELSTEGGGGPQTYAEIQPKFIRHWHPEKYEKLPELLVILDQNFIRGEDERWTVPDTENSAHLEFMREHELLREFAEYASGAGRIRIFRSEAIKAGFSHAWAEHRYREIIHVAERLPEQALQENPKLKLYYDNALNRAPIEIKQERLL